MHTSVINHNPYIFYFLYIDSFMLPSVLRYIHQLLVTEKYKKNKVILCLLDHFIIIMLFLYHYNFIVKTFCDCNILVCNYFPYYFCCVYINNNTRFVDRFFIWCRKITFITYCIVHFSFFLQVGQFFSKLYC